MKGAGTREIDHMTRRTKTILLTALVLAGTTFGNARSAGATPVDNVRKSVNKVAGHTVPGKNVCRCETGTYANRNGSLHVSEVVLLGNQSHFEVHCLTETYSVATGLLLNTDACDGTWRKLSK